MRSVVVSILCVSLLTAVAIGLVSCGSDSGGVTPPPPSGKTVNWSWAHPTPQGNSFYGIGGKNQFTLTVALWAVGANGLVSSFEGNAVGWVLHDSPTDVDLYDIAVLDFFEEEIFIVGADGTLLKRSGDTFVPEAHPGTSDLLSLNGYRPDSLVAVGRGGTILERKSAGWSAVSSPTAVDLNSVWEIEPTGERYAVGQSGEVLHYSGGAWTRETPFTSANLYDVWASKPGDWFTVGENGEIWHKDAGPWAQMTSGVSDDLFAVFGSDSAWVFAAGAADSVLFYNDISWEPLLPNPVPTLWAGWGALCISISPNGPQPGAAPAAPMHCSSGTVVGDAGMAIEYDLFNQAFIRSGTITTADLHDIDGASSSEVYAVADSGVVLLNDGTVWRRDANTGVSENLRGVWVNGPGDVRAVGDGGRIVRRAGGAWMVETSGTVENLRGVWGSGANDIFAVGANGTVLHNDGGGWSSQSAPVASYFGVWGSGPGDVFAVGAGGSVAHWDGSAWQAMSTGGFLGTLYAVWGSNSDNVFAVGESGAVLRYDGAAWTQSSSGTTSNLTDVWGDGNGVVLATAGCSGSVLRFGGTQWRERKSPAAGTCFSALWGPSSEDCFVVGEIGKILNYQER